MKPNASDRPDDDSDDNALTNLAFEILRARNGELLARGPAVDHWVNESFKDAISLAERLRATVRNRGSERIHAYRLFSKNVENMSGAVDVIGSEPMSVPEIRSRFKEVGWSDGMTVGTVRNRVREILQHAEDEVKRRTAGYNEFLEHHGWKWPDIDAIHDLVGGMLMDFAAQNIVRDIGQLQANMTMVVARMIDQAFRPVTNDVGGCVKEPDCFTVAGFMKFLCGHDSLDDAKESSGDFRVRPYELFLYAHQVEILEDKLTKPLKELSADFVPAPEYRSRMSIMVSHGGVDEALQEWEKEEEEHRRSMEEAERFTEAELAVKRLRESKWERQILADRETQTKGERQVKRQNQVEVETSGADASSKQVKATPAKRANKKATPAKQANKKRGTGNKRKKS